MDGKFNATVLSVWPWKHADWLSWGITVWFITILQLRGGIKKFPWFKVRWQVRFFLLQKIFRKWKNVTLSVFYRVCSDQMVWNSFKPCSLHYVFPPSSLSKVSCTGKSALWVHLLASSEILSMQSDTSISCILSNNIFTKVHAFVSKPRSYCYRRSIWKHQEVNLTNGDCNGKWCLGIKSFRYNLLWSFV